MRKILISPSILNADFSKLGEQCLALQQSGADWIHCDVMDGVFVPNISFGLPVVEGVYKSVDIPLDVHLMIRDPLPYVEKFVNAGAKIVTFHAESQCDGAKVCREIHRLGATCGVSVKPNTPLEKVKDLLEMADMILVMSVEPGFGGQSYIASSTEKIALARKLFPDKLIQVDGGINAHTAAQAVKAGADVLVVGSALLNAADKKGFIAALKALG